MPSWLSGVVEISLRAKLRTYNDLSERVLGEWADLDQRALQVAFAKWTNLTADSATIDERNATAIYAGEDFYETMFPLAQTMTNLLTAGLFHLFEQHLCFLARAMMSRLDVPDSMMGIFSLFDQQLNIDIRSSYSMSNRLNELRLIANVVKHAEDRIKSAYCASRRQQPGDSRRFGRPEL